MKITYNENPLRTVVELDEHDKQVFWLKIKVEELQDLLFDANFHLTQEKFFDLDLARKASDPDRYIKEDHQEKTTIDERVDMVFDLYVRELTGTHAGDCTCEPCSCMKCRAEDILGVNTIENSPGSHALNYIDRAFFCVEDEGIKQRSISDALTYLRDRKISRQKPDTWNKTSQEEYESYIPRWEAHQLCAYEYLKNYAKKHFNVDF